MISLDTASSQGLNVLNASTRSLESSGSFKAYSEASGSNQVDKSSKIHETFGYFFFKYKD